MKDYLEAEMQRLFKVASRSNDLMISMAQERKASGLTKTKIEDIPFYITHHRNFVELSTVVAIYCDNYPDERYLGLKKTAEEFLRNSENCLQNVIRALEISS